MLEAMPREQLRLWQAQNILEPIGFPRDEERHVDIGMALAKPTTDREAKKIAERLRHQLPEEVKKLLPKPRPMTPEEIRRKVRDSQQRT